MLRGLIYSIISAACFGTLPVLGKLGYELGMQTFELLAFRYGSAALLLGCWLAVTRPSALRIGPRTLAKTALLGLCIYPIQSTCFLSALKYIPASTTSLIFYLYPATVALASMVVLRQRPTRAVWASVGMVVSGCALVFLNAFMRHADLLGVLFALGAMGMYTTYLLVAQVVLKGEPRMTVVFYTIAFAASVFTASAWPLDLGAFTPARAAVAVSLGLVPTVLAVTLLYAAIEFVGSTLVSIFSALEPVFTLALAVCLLGEPVALWQMAGALLIVAGIVLPNLSQARRGAALPPQSPPPPIMGS